MYFFDILIIFLNDLYSKLNFIEEIKLNFFLTSFELLNNLIHISF
jgi:hypothetical protein